MINKNGLFANYLVYLTDESLGLFELQPHVVEDEGVDVCLFLEDFRQGLEPKNGRDSCIRSIFFVLLPPLIISYSYGQQIKETHTRTMDRHACLRSDERYFMYGR
jgi:hypothetical protein